LNDDEKFMKIAIEQAKLAYKLDEVPIGAVVVDKNGEIISMGHNLRESKKSPSAHAEVLAIEEACKKLETWRLLGCTIYVTLEPCIMCAGLMHQSRISRCVFGAFDKKAGALSTLYQIGNDERLNHNFDVEGGVLEEECAKLLSDFFKARR
jgi:tRNA(adenine34) deaminase